MKKQIREAFFKRLSAMDLSSREQQAQVVTKRLIESQEWAKAQTIGITMSSGFELPTMPIIKLAWQQHKTVVVPRTMPKRQMEFVEFQPTTIMHKSGFGIMEPVGGRVLSKQDLELLIVPGVAFSVNHDRLGFGGGYYDRYLADYQGKTITLAFMEQIVENPDWKIEAFDQQPSVIITANWRSEI